MSLCFGTAQISYSNISESCTSFYVKIANIVKIVCLRSIMLQDLSLYIKYWNFKTKEKQFTHLVIVLSGPALMHPGLEFAKDHHGW